MTDLPGKDTIDAIERHMGKWPTRILVWTIAIALFLGGVAAIVSSLRASFSWLQPYLPQVAVPEALFRIATGLAYVLLGFLAWILFRRGWQLAR